MNTTWVLKMAVRIGRQRMKRLLSFSLSIVLGVAAFVAIDSFNLTIQQSMDDESTELLGADISFNHSQVISDSLRLAISAIDGEHSEEFQFNSMVQFDGRGTRLALVRALSGGFPFYGELETLPTSAANSFQGKRGALVAKTLMIQFDLKVGDSIQIGVQKFEVQGQVDKAPGQTAMSFAAAPPVYIDAQYIIGTPLLEKGSRVKYVDHVKLKNRADVNDLEKQFSKAAEREFVTIETVEKRKDRYNSILGNFNKFLAIIGFVSILLGSLGIASSVFAYAKESKEMVAVLRCLGATGREASAIFFVQIFVVGIIGSALGIVLSLGIQYFLPTILAFILPNELEFTVFYSSILTGFALGISVTVLFSLYPLLKIAGVAPMSVIRAVDFSEVKITRSKQLIIALSMVVYVLGFSFLILKSFYSALLFSAALGVIVAVLYFFSLGVMRLARVLARRIKSYLWRQGISNLYRPNNQTTTIVFTLGMGTALVGMLFFVQDFLLTELKYSGEGDKPNMILFDVKKDQKEELLNFITSSDVELKEQVSIVTMRLKGIKGKSREELKSDSLSTIPKHVLDREYRVTYRNELKESEEIVAGKWKGVHQKGEPFEVSLEERTAQQAGVVVGDKLLFSISGVPTEVVVGSIRKVNWSSFTTNFTVLFPEGVLEKAPQFLSYSVKVSDVEKSALFQRDLVKAFPNVSVIDLDLIIDTVTTLLDQVVLAIRFLTILCVITGLIVLVSSVVTSKYQRIKENVLLRTIGASIKQLLAIIGIEFFALGNIAVLVGLVLAMVLAWLSSYYFLEVNYVFNAFVSISIYVLLVFTVFVLGLFLNRKIVRRSPIEVLREEI